MKLSQTDIEDVILQVFMDRKLVPDDEVLLSRLELFWKQTGLRKPDLLHGVVRLAAKGQLKLSEESNETYVSLTTEGQARGADSLPGNTSAWRRWLLDEVLPAMRRKASDDDEVARRTTDRQVILTTADDRKGRFKR